VQHWIVRIASSAGQQSCSIPAGPQLSTVSPSVDTFPKLAKSPRETSKERLIKDMRQSDNFLPVPRAVDLQKRNKIVIKIMPRKFLHNVPCLS
jgi:hypothetical protein